MTGTVYAIKNLVNGKFYIGKTVRDYNTRVLLGHFSMLKNNKHSNKHLQSSWNKYGQCAFIYGVIEGDIIKSDINKKEMYWINYYNSCDLGYNKTRGGDGGFGTSHNKGRKHSDKSKLNMRLAKLGRKLKEETKIKISNKLKGHKMLPHVLNALNTARKKKIVDNDGNIYASTAEAANVLNINRSVIKEILNGRNKKTKNGMSFKFL